jgi:hypothetical protein
MVGSALPTASVLGRTQHPARVAAKLLKVTGAGTISSRSGNAMVDGLIGLWVGYFAIFAA